MKQLNAIVNFKISLIASKLKPKL